jgi:hypothetical protein
VWETCGGIGPYTWAERNWCVGHEHGGGRGAARAELVSRHGRGSGAIGSNEREHVRTSLHFSMYMICLQISLCCYLGAAIAVRKRWRCGGCVQRDSSYRNFCSSAACGALFSRRDIPLNQVHSLRRSGPFLGTRAYA